MWGAAEVKVLIKQSATEVSQDSRLVAATDGKPNTILYYLGTNSTLIESIVSASQERSSAIAEMSVAIRQMDGMPQHNAVRRRDQRCHQPDGSPH